MTARVQVVSEDVILKLFRREILRELRREAGRVRTNIRRVAPQGRTGNLKRAIKVRAGWDSEGPYARITTGARRTTRNERTGEVTRFRYGLAIQQKEQYLEQGLARTPRRR